MLKVLSFLSWKTQKNKCCVREHPFSTCAYQGVRNVNFPESFVYVNFCVRKFSPWEIPVSKCLSGKAKFHYKETRKQNENYLTLLPKYSSIRQSCKYFLVLDLKKLHYREKENLVQIFLNANMQWFKKDPSQWKIAWKIFPRKRKKVSNTKLENISIHLLLPFLDESLNQPFM